MKAVPNLIVSETCGGTAIVWKCPACSDPFDLLLYRGTEKEKIDAMYAAYHKHFKDRHQYDEDRPAAKNQP